MLKNDNNRKTKVINNEKTRKYEKTPLREGC
jgi:hypothetical protein